MLHPTIKHPRRLGGLAIRVLLALAVAGLPGCGDQSPTDPEEPAAQAAQRDGLAADLSADQSAASPAAAGTLAVTATRLPKSFFVNPITGKDTNAGTKLQPFKTLAHGLGLAIAGDTMRLASGVYSAATNGEKFTGGLQQVLVPAGVMILGTLAEGSTSQLHGAAGETGLNLQGAATVRNLIVTGFPTAIRATQGVQSLKNVILDQNTFGLDLSGSAKATLVASSVLLNPPPVAAGDIVGANVAQQAQLTLVGGTINGGSQNCRTSVKGVSLGGAARLTLKNGATLNNIAGFALTMAGTSKATLTGLATIGRSFSQLPGGCTPLASVLTSDSSTLTLKNARVLSIGGTNSVGILSQSRGLLTLDSAQVSGHSGTGLKSPGNLKLVATASSFQSNVVGIDVANSPNSSITITGSTVSNNGIGIHAPFFKLRKSEVTSNGTGILVASFSSDLGQTGDPGNNRITANSNTGVTWDAHVISSKAGGIFAVGNTWSPRIQGSDDNGKYSPQVLSGSSPLANGTNFKLPGFSFQIQL
jgi:hypothetical protein